MLDQNSEWIPGPDPAGPRLLVSAGEVSGDVYAAGLLEALQRLLPGLQAYGLGGPRLQAAGLKLLADVRARAAVGLSENLGAIPYFMGLKVRLLAWMRRMRPDALLLVDFQGFNLQLAAAAKQLGIPVIYFIAPQDWIWGFRRGLARIVAHVDLILAVFPQEAAFYARAGAHVCYVGHPLLDLLPAADAAARAEARQRLGLHAGPVVCWMPGSRKAEVARLLPVMARIRSLLKPVGGRGDLLPLAASFLKTGPQPGFRLIEPEARYDAMLAADAIIGASGSMVLEAALLGRPVLAMYRVSPLTFAVASRLLRLPWITLPNILLERPLVPEYVQRLPEADIAARLQQLITAPDQNWQAAASELREMLGPAGAYARAAAAIADFLARRT